MRNAGAGFLADFVTAADILPVMAATETMRDASPGFREIARKLIWWKSVDEALQDPIRLACQVMTYGTWNDVLLARRELGDELFKRALRNAPAGVFDERSWNFWHLVFGMLPVPPLPTRTFE